jgi:hypothetical protein
MRREGVVVFAQAAEVHHLRDAGSRCSVPEGPGTCAVALGEVDVRQRVDQVEGDLLAIERRPEAPNVSDVTPHRRPRAAILLGAARHGGDVVVCRTERGRDMPADKSGGTRHQGLHVCSKPNGWPSIRAATTRRCPVDTERSRGA